DGPRRAARRGARGREGAAAHRDGQPAPLRAAQAAIGIGTPSARYSSRPTRRSGMTARPTVTLHSDPATLFRSLEEYQQAFYNLLAPTTAIGYVPELHEISVRPVWVSAADDC